MSTFSTLGISASGLTAQRARMDVISKNIANAQTTRTPAGGPYRRQHVVFATRRDGGVEVVGVQESQGELPRVPNAGHPDADADGMVTMPDIDMVIEMVDMISATRTYEANIAAMNATKSMISRALDLARG